jgi:hypothetical protein
LNAIEIRAGLDVSAHFYESEKVGDDRLGASILVGSIVMKTIHAGACGRIHQRNLEVILAQKPIERRHCGSRPVRLFIHAHRGEAGRDRCGGLDRLLVERLRRSVTMTEAI